MDRYLLVRLATEADGLRYPDPRYVDLLMPAGIEPPANRAALAGQSSCALLVRALLRACGCTHPFLLRPYRVGRAVSDVIQIARDAGAWHEPGDAERPAAGDAVIVGAPGHEHAYVVTAVRSHAPGWRVDSIDGGQGAHGAGIAARTRSWPDWAREWVDVVDAGAGAPEMARPVRGWADVGLL